MADENWDLVDDNDSSEDDGELIYCPQVEEKALVSEAASSNTDTNNYAAPEVKVVDSQSDDEDKDDDIEEPMTAVPETVVNLDEVRTKSEASDSLFDDHDDDQDDEDDDDDDTASVSSNVGASAAAGGVIGLMVGGPVLSVIGAVGAGFASTTEGPAGDLARKGGDVVTNVGNKAKEVNEKHGITDRVKKMTQVAGERMREAEEKHGVLDKVKDFFRKAGDGAVRFETENHFVENFLSGISKGADNLAERIRQAQARKASEAANNMAGAQVV